MNTLRGHRLTNARQSVSMIDDDRTTDLTTDLPTDVPAVQYRAPQPSGAPAPAFGEAPLRDPMTDDESAGSDTPTLLAFVDGASTPVARHVAWELHHAGIALLEANEAVVRGIVHARSARPTTRRRLGRTSAAGRRSPLDAETSPGMVTVRFTQQAANRVEVRAVAESTDALSTVGAALNTLGTPSPHRNESTRR